MVKRSFFWMCMANNYYGVIPAIIRYDKTLSALDKLVYCDIHARSNSKGYCWPSNKQISEDLGFKSRTVSQSITRLVERGYLIREDRSDLSTHRALHPSTTMLPPSTTMLPPWHERATPPSTSVLPKDSKEKKYKERTNKNPPTPQGGMSDDFKMFYEAYPRKQAKQDAIKAFNASKKMPAIKEIVDSIERWKQSDQWTRDGGQFIPYPATWIRQRRWEDDIPRSEAERQEEKRRQTDDEIRRLREKRKADVPRRFERF